MKEDASQSQTLGNCYFIAGLVAFAEDRDRLDKVFVIKEANNAGIYAFNLYLRGKPIIVTIDDRIAFKQGATSTQTVPLFADIGVDGALWAPLLEKAWAKLHGNYERTAAGWQHEALRVVSGAPSYDYLTSKYEADEIWELLDEADRKNYIMGAGTAGTGDHALKNSVGLSQSHAYSVIGAYALKDGRGNIVEKLLLLRNPWGFETYSGPYSDNDSRWTQGANLQYPADFRTQVPYENKDQGVFFIDMDTFKASFLYFLVQYHRADWVVNYYEVLEDDGRLHKFFFDVGYTQDMHVAADTYDPRMYPYGCKDQKVMAQMLVRKVGSTEKIAEKYFSDWIGFGHVFIEDVPPGKYEIYVQYAWPADQPTVNDFTIRVYAPETFPIKDTSGAESRNTSHDFDLWDEVLREREEEKSLEDVSAQMISELKAVVENPALKGDYTYVDEGWYNEITGPVVVTNQITSAKETHNSRSLYIYSESQGTYDLSLQIAVKTKDMPKI